MALDLPVAFYSSSDCFGPPEFCAKDRPGLNWEAASALEVVRDDCSAARE